MTMEMNNYPSMENEKWYISFTEVSVMYGVIIGIAWIIYAVAVADLIFIAFVILICLAPLIDRLLFGCHKSKGSG